MVVKGERQSAVRDCFCNRKNAGTESEAPAIERLEVDRRTEVIYFDAIAAQAADHLVTLLASEAFPQADHISEPAHACGFGRQVRAMDCIAALEQAVVKLG